MNNAGQLHWPDADGMFPSGNRGWAYAGYNADHADADAVDGETGRWSRASSSSKAAI